MKRNYIPEGHTYAPSEIAERNEQIDALCARIQPYALATFESAVMRQTTDESAAELAEEARAALLEVLADPGDVLLDEETVRLKEALAAALKQEPKTLRKSSDAAWMARRGADLARAVVGFWVDLGEEATSRYKASIALLDDMAGPHRSGLKRRFELIYSRFRLDANEAGGLLNRLNAAVLIGKFIETAAPSIDQATVEIFWDEIPSEPPAELVKAAAHKPHSFEAPLLVIDRSSPSYEPVMDLLKIVGDIHRDQYVRIEKGNVVLRERRIAAYCHNTALMYGAIQAAAALFKKHSGSINIQSASTRRPVKTAPR